MVKNIENKYKNPIYTTKRGDGVGMKALLVLRYAVNQVKKTCFCEFIKQLYFERDLLFPRVTFKDTSRKMSPL